jgi:SAM-dependent methyltransferase
MTPPLIFDRSLLRARRQRGLRLGPETFLLDRVADELAQRLSLVLRRFDLAVDLGTPAAAVRTALLRSGSIGTVIALDPIIGLPASLPHTAGQSHVARPPCSPPPCGEGSGVGVVPVGTFVANTPDPPPRPSPTRGEGEEMAAPHAIGLPRTPGRVREEGPGDHAAAATWRVVADEEALPFADNTLDLVVSALSLQAVNDLPGVLVQVRRALKPDGLFLAALLGGDTLVELRQSFAVAESELEGGVSPRVAPFPDLRDMGALLQRAGFAVPVTDVDRITVRYATPLGLLRDLRHMGAANPLVERRRVPLRRATLARAMESYAERFADPDGRVRASFDIIWLSGWSPHESQQKPLRPGSAKTRLADALGTAEMAIGEKPQR